MQTAPLHIKWPHRLQRKFTYQSIVVLITNGEELAQVFLLEKPLLVRIVQDFLGQELLEDLSGEVMDISGLQRIHDW